LNISDQLAKLSQFRQPNPVKFSPSAQVFWGSFGVGLGVWHLNESAKSGVKWASLD